MKLKQFLRKRRSKSAISEVIGAMLLIAVTIVIGFATWIWAGGAASSTEGNYGNAVAANVHYLDEQFSIVNANFSSTSMTVWFYNYGNTTVYIMQVWATNASSAATGTWPYTTSTLSSTLNSNCNSKCLEVPVHSVASVTINTGNTISSTVTYEIKATGYYGNTYTYEQSG